MTTLYVALCRARAVGELGARLVREGVVPLCPSTRGQEAAIVGPAFALGPGDWLVPGTRDIGAALCRGMPLGRYLDSLVGQDAMAGQFSWRAGQVAGMSPVAGARLMHAVGIGWAARSRGERVAALVGFGAGEIASADFHNALNFAGVFRAPVVFVCRGEAEDRDHGAAYGVATARCDGHDPLALVQVTRAALERGRRGGGATLIEAVLGSHRGPEAVAAQEGARDGATEHDDLARLRRLLERSGDWDEGRQAELDSRLQGELDAALSAARRRVAPAKGRMFDQVYAELPGMLVAQRAELLGNELLGAELLGAEQSGQAQMTDEPRGHEPVAVEAVAPARSGPTVAS